MQETPSPEPGLERERVNRRTIPSGRWPRRIAFLLLAAYALWYLFLALAAPLPTVVNGLLDDSFYYLQVARNAARGLGSTFDGVEPTNGYHPLWMWMLIPVNAVTRGAPEATLRVALLLSGLLGVGSLWLLRRLLRARSGEWGAVIGLLLFAWPRVFGLTTNLLESGLVLLLLLAVAAVLQRGGDDHGRGVRSPALLLGLLLGATCLARLDTAFLSAAFGVIALRAVWERRFPWDGPSAPPRSRIRVLATTGGILAVAMALVVPFLAWNLLRFGHPQPVSGFVKSTFPHARPHWEYLVMYKEFTLLLALGLVFFVASWRSQASPWLRTLGLFGLAAGLHMAWTVLFMGWGVDRWYFLLLIPAGLLGIPALVEEAMARLPSRPARVSRSALIAGGILAALGVQAVSYRLREGRHLGATREAALWARDHLPADTVFGMSDSGVFAWFSGRTTVNLDGLINNYRFQEALHDGRFPEYLAERRVGYLYDQWSYRRPEILDGTYRTRTLRFWYYPENRVAGQIVLDRADEVFRRNLRSRPGALAPAEPNALILYRYRPGAPTGSPEDAASGRR